MDMSLYEGHRDEQVRDEHIAYARSARDKIVEGYSLDWVIDRLLFEVPCYAKDPTLLSELLNYFLEESRHPLRFDHGLNMFENGIEVRRSNGEAIFAEAFANRDKTLDAMASETAKGYGARLVTDGPSMVPTILGWLKGDVVYYTLDNALVARYLNQYLTLHGSTLQVDRYLQPVDGENVPTSVNIDSVID